MTTRSQLRRAARMLIPVAATMGTRCTVVRVPALPAASPSASSVALPRDAAIADVDTLMRTLEDVHPDLYAVRSRAATARARAQMTAAFPASMTRAELWVRLAPFVAGFGDGHTTLYKPGGEVAQMGSTAPGFTYRPLGRGVGYMNLASFSGDANRLADDVAELFRLAAADADRSLIIDVRENSSGDSRLADELLRHITTKPYRMSARKDWKMSAEYRAYLKSFVHWPLSWTSWRVTPLGDLLFSGPDGRIVEFSEPPAAHGPREPFFAGSVCVLIGPRTFSSAVDFADAVKTYHLATLIGEETGGRPTGFGEVYLFRLPRSQLAVSVSSAFFVRANGDETDASGVAPDIAITSSDADVRAGRDVVLERARTCP